MATSTVSRKGPGSASAAIPPRSFPARQRKLGPAPFASFDSFDDNDSSPPDPAEKLQPMPEIKEDGGRNAEEEQQGAGGGITQFGGVTVIPLSGSTTVTTTMTSSSSGTGPLQTPSTPRIDISCASSSTPPSEESNSERELFSGGLGLAFQEEGADDLRSSTEELEFGTDDIHDERRTPQREPNDPLRRASQPALPRKASMTPTDEDYLTRKPSAHSLYLEGFLQRPCRHSSFGASDRIRPGAISSLSADGRRSASPHKMLLETSFCGNKPIPTPSLDLESPPKPPLDEPRLLPTSENSGMLSSDSSFESHKPLNLTTLTTVQVHHHHHHHSSSTTTTPGTTTANIAPSISSSPREESCSSSSTRKTLHRIQTPDSPKSSDHWKPISPKPVCSSSVHGGGASSSSPDNQNRFFNDFTSSSCSSPLPTARKNSNTSSPITLTMSRRNSNKLINESNVKGGMPPSASSPTSSLSSTSKTGTPTTTTSDKFKTNSGDSQNGKANGNNTFNNNNNSNNNTTSNTNARSTSQFSNSEKISRSADSKSTTTTTSRHASAATASTTNTSATPGSKSKSKESKTVKDVKGSAQQKESSSVASKERGASNSIDSKGKKGKASGKNKDSPSSSSQITQSQNFENDEITTEMKISEGPMVPVDDAMPLEPETKGFFLDSLEDEEDLPYVPTTLPLEKSVPVKITPIKERRKLATMVTTTPTQRPRCQRPPNPASLSDYITSTTNAAQNSSSLSSKKADSTTQQKMKINLPRDDSLPDSSSPNTPARPKSPKKKLSTTWDNFAEMGLRSPREIRRRLREENGATDDVAAYHSDSSQDTAGPVNCGSDEETESLLKLPKIPFAMDLDVKSNRSSVVSQEEPLHSPQSLSSAQLDLQENEDE